MALRFPAYRRYSQARVASNDAMIALLISSRLGKHVLETSAADPSVPLPVLFRQLPGIDRLNVTSARAVELLDASEQLLGQMAIPYVLSVHEAFLADAIGMVKDAGKDPASSTWAIPRAVNVETIELKDKHSYIAERTGFPLPQRELDLFELARVIRNRIVHYAGGAGPRLVGLYRQLPKDSKDRWRKLTGRPLTIGSDDVISLGEGELRAVLATARLLGIAVNEALADSLSSSYWASVVVADYRSEYPERFAERTRRERRVMGFARKNYSRLQLSDEDIRSALRNSEGGSSY